MDEKLLCCVCGEELSADEVRWFGGDPYCEDCLGDCAIICDCCGDRVSEDNSRSDSNYVLCSSCFDEYYFYCESCEAIIANEDACYIDDEDEYLYCNSCYSREIRHRIIHDYGYKPEPIFYGEGQSACPQNVF